MQIECRAPLMRWSQWGVAVRTLMRSRLSQAVGLLGGEGVRGTS